MRALRARVGYASGIIAASSGVGVVFGYGWGLIMGGTAMAASFLLLYDVDERPQP